MADLPATRPGEVHSMELCLACGICCTGALHPTALLARDEIELATSLKLTVLQHPDDCDQRLFALGCPRFTGRCSVFPTRPRVCGEYRCGLLEDYLQERVTSAEALEIVRKTKDAIRALEEKIGTIPPGTTIHEEAQRRLKQMPTDAAEERRAYMELLLEAQALRIALGRFLKPKDEGNDRSAERGESDALPGSTSCSATG